MFDFLEEKLRQQAETGTLRTLPKPLEGIDFFSNDYLGFSRLNFLEIVDNSGSTGSRLMSGNSAQAEECEDKLAEYFDAEAALVFNSGYAANLGFWSCVPQRGDLILYDSHCHASIIDGIRLSFADKLKFPHNDYQTLEKELAKYQNRRCFVAIEGIYSMQGDFAELKTILVTANRFGALVVVDEAHSAGVVGDSGRGFVHGIEELDLCFARIVTFGKAFGFHGAAVLGSKVLKEYLINFCRPFIYTTALPPNDYSQITARLNPTLVREKQIQLHNNIKKFRALIGENSKLGSSPNSPIQIWKDKIECLELIAKNLKNKGIFTKIIHSPTVPKGEECLRICLHAFNTEEEVKLLVKGILKID